MEYLSGQDLASVLSSAGRLHWRRSVDIAMQVCDALSYAHAHGVVHRDLKPQNIMILDNQTGGRREDVDFGLASLMLPTAQKMTRTGVLLASPHYMSPEMCSGRKAD